MSSLTPLLKPDVTLSLTLTSSPPSRTTSHEGLKPEERGIRLIQLLLSCANHASSGNLHCADACLSEITELSSVSGDPMQRLAARFASALAIRLVKRWPGLYKALCQAQEPKLDQERARAVFGHAFPYLSLAYAMIAQTLLRAMTEERMVHIVDLGSGDSKLWVPLLHSFANLPDGPPQMRVSCVHGNKAVLERLGHRLVKEAETLGMPLQFNPLNVCLEELTVDMLKVRSGEALAFMSVLSLHVLLAEDDRVDAHFGAGKSITIKDCKQMGDFLAMVRSMSPKLFFLVEQEADHNLNRLVDRFAQGLYYYSAMFDSIDATLGASSASEERLVLEEMFGKEIENVVACEGMERCSRHERYAKWVIRLTRAGFRPIRMWYDSSDEAMVDAFCKDGYKIVSDRSSLMICWHERPLYAVTAWTC